jgi:GNAT superfamily N-acetyltransferase
MRIEFRIIREDGPAKYWQVEVYSAEGNMFPVGIAWVVSVGDSAQLNYFLVGDQWRNQGYGGALLKGVKNRWKSVTYTNPLNREAAKLLGSTIGPLKD